MRRRSRSTLFPYTTLFRSKCGAGDDAGCEGGGGDDEIQRGVAEGGGAAGSRWAPSAYRGHARDLCRRSEEHTSELQSQSKLVCRLLLEIKNLSARLLMIRF